MFIRKKKSLEGKNVQIGFEGEAFNIANCRHSLIIFYSTMKSAKSMLFELNDKTCDECCFGNHKIFSMHEQNSRQLITNLNLVST